MHCTVWRAILISSIMSRNPEWKTSNTHTCAESHQRMCCWQAGMWLLRTMIIERQADALPICKCSNSPSCEKEAHSPHVYMITDPSVQIQWEKSHRAIAATCCPEYALHRCRCHSKTSRTDAISCRRVTAMSQSYVWWCCAQSACFAGNRSPPPSHRPHQIPCQLHEWMRKTHGTNMWMVEPATTWARLQTKVDWHTNSNRKLWAKRVKMAQTSEEK